MEPIFLTKRIDNKSKEEHKEKTNTENLHQKPFNSQLSGFNALNRPKGGLYKNSFTSRLNPNGIINLSNEFNMFGISETKTPFKEEKDQYLDLLKGDSRKSEEHDLCIEEVKVEDLRKELPPNFKIDFDDDSSDFGEKTGEKSQEEKKKPKKLRTNSKRFNYVIPVNEDSLRPQKRSRMLIDPQEVKYHERKAPSIEPPSQDQFPYDQKLYTKNQFPNPKNYSSNIMSNSSQSNDRFFFKKLQENCKTREETISMMILKSINNYELEEPNKSLKEVKFKLNLQEYNKILFFVKSNYKLGKKKTEPLSRRYAEIMDYCKSILIKQKYDPNKKEKLIEEQQKEHVENIYTKLNTHQLKQISFEDKDISSKFQVYLKYAEEEDLMVVFEKMKTCLYELSFDQYGNYIVQIMIERSEVISDFLIENYCLQFFDEMLENQFSSRVLQKTLSSKNEKVKELSMKKLKRNFYFFIKELSSVIFVTKLINEIDDENEFYFIENILKETNGGIIVKFPNVLRILVSIFSKFSDNILKRMFKILKKFIWNLLNDKFGNYILQKIIEKNLDPFKEIIEEKCLSNASRVILKKYPRFILLKLIENDANGIFCERFFRAVCFNQKPYFVHKKLIWKKETSSLVLLSLFGLRNKKIAEFFEKFVGILMEDSVSFDKGTNQCKSYFFKFF